MDQSDEENPAPRPPRPSQAPSWVMVGFVVGALFVFALPRRQPSATVAAVPALEPAPPVRLPEKISFSNIEAVFAEWGKYAVWDHDTTEVALWDGPTKSYRDCYEVLRVGEDFYFRSISRFTRPILTHGVIDASPLLFTETVRQHQAWLAEKEASDWRAIANSARESIGNKPALELEKK